jgi:hypothetical protein
MIILNIAMQKIPACLILAACVLSARALATPTIDLTPVPQEYELEGIKRTLVSFRAGAGPVLYAPPWKIAGYADSACLDVPERHASAEIRRVPLSEPLDLRDEDATKKWVIDHLPPAATNVSIDDFARNPVSIDGKPTVEVTVSYGLFGLYRRHSLLLCERRQNLYTDLVIFEFAAPPAKFDLLYRIFQKSLYSMMGF